MTKENTDFTGVVALLKREHINFFKEIDRFHNSLNNLHYEGKVSLGKNTKAIEKTIKYFKDQVFPHVTFEEDVLFDFLSIHMPRLDPTLRFLRADHKEFKANFRNFESLFKKFKAEKNDLKRNKIQEKLRIKGVYIIFLMRNHIRLEDESICKAMDKEFHPEEKKLFLKQMKQKYKGK